MLIQLLATLFLILGARKLAMLSDIGILEAFTYYDGSSDVLTKLVPNELSTGDRMMYYILSKFYAGVIAALIAFAISLTISIKNRIFWLNSFFVIILTIAISRLHFFDLYAVKTISSVAGELFWSFGLHAVYLINAILLITIGFFIFFNPWTKKFIRKQYPEEHFAPKKLPEKEEWVWD